MRHLSTGKAIFIRSVLLLLLCLMLFTGTTLAWLTDNVISESVVRAGNLHVDMEHLENGEWISLKENPGHKVFHYNDWEPGRADVAVLKIKNAGSLALRFKLLAALDATTTVLGPNGEDLAKVVDVYFYYGNRATATKEELEGSGEWRKMGTVADILEQRYVFGGKVLPADMGFEPEGQGDGATTVGEAYISIALYMRETAENEYQHLAVGEFVLSLNAVQSTFEEDSFDELYDRIPTPAYIYDDGEMHELNDALILSPGGVYTEAITATGANTSLTIDGGYYDSADQSHTAKAENGAVINITGGTFLGDGEEGSDQTVIVAGNGGTVNIYGGKFYAREDGIPLLGDEGGDLTVYGGTFTDWDPSNNCGKDGPNYLATGTALQTDTLNGETVYIVTPVENTFVEDKNGNFSVEADTIVMNSAFCQRYDVFEDYVVDGKGHTVTINAFPENDFKGWDPGGTRPDMSTMFSSNNNSLVTIKNLTFTGQMQATFIGHYRRKEDPYYRVPFTSVLDNFNIIDAQVAPSSNPFAMALICYGTVDFYHCTFKGTTLLPFVDPQPVYDVALTNNTKAYLHDGTYIENLYMWETSRLEVNDGTRVDYILMRAVNTANGLTVNAGGHVGYVEVRDDFAQRFYQRFTIKSGATVDVLDLTGANSPKYFTVEDGATIGKVVDGDMEYASYAEWLAAQG